MGALKQARGSGQAQDPRRKLPRGAGPGQAAAELGPAGWGGGRCLGPWFLARSALETSLGFQEGQHSGRSGAQRKVHTQWAWSPALGKGHTAAGRSPARQAHKARASESAVMKQHGEGRAALCSRREGRVRGVCFKNHIYCEPSSKAERNTCLAEKFRKHHKQYHHK